MDSDAGDGPEALRASMGAMGGNQEQGTCARHAGVASGALQLAVVLWCQSADSLLGMCVLCTMRMRAWLLAR